MTFVESLRALLDRRLFDCRLTPDRALGTLAEAEAFRRGRGLLTRTADLRTELRLNRQELTALRAPRERCGAVIARSRQVTAGEGHQHASELIRWDQARPAPGASRTDPRQALAGLTAAAVRAAVLAP